MRFLNEQATSTHPRDPLILQIGKFFLGRRYAAGTLETRGAEHVVVNLREFDCFTFVENAVALALHRKSRKDSFEAFRRSLRKMRYRNGRLQGYASRLHYFSDWIYNNRKKGILKDVTAAIGGRPFRKSLNFMTTHPDLYPPLRNGTNLRRMKAVEKTAAKRFFSFIPRKDLRRLECRILDGDLVAVTTNMDGLDVQHVGLAVRVRNRIHLLHASSLEKKVTLSKETLYRYLMKNRTGTGIMVGRVNLREKV
jgi:hypothetical protein